MQAPFPPVVRATPFMRGFSLTEAMVVLAVSAILAMAAMPSFHGLLDSHRVDGAATQLASDLQLARAEAVARNAPVRVSLIAADGQPTSSNTAAACYVLHTGPSRACRCSGTGAAACSAQASAIKTVDLTATGSVQVQANVASMLFDPLHGTASPTGSFTVISDSGRTVQHVVNLMGRVRSCSPGASVSGYRRCA